jgi:hypothetical protein
MSGGGCVPNQAGRVERLRRRATPCASVPYFDAQISFVTSTIIAEVDQNSTCRGRRPKPANPEPRRLRDREHVRFLAKQPCLCGRNPSDPHHLRFVQRQALGRRVSDEYTVPLAAGIIASCIVVLTKRFGGKGLQLTQLLLPAPCGCRHIRCRQPGHNRYKR